MAKFGAAIERVVVMPPVDGLFKELHLVRFPDAAALAAYRAAPELAAASGLRARAVVATEVLVGEDGAAY